MSLEQEFVEFRTLENVTPTYATFGYTDRTNKSVSIVTDMVDDRPVHRKFRFEDGVLRIHKSDVEGLEFMRNHSQCLGSVNCQGMASFREYDRFAEVAKQEAAAMRLHKAIDIAATVRGTSMERLALMLGLGTNVDRARLILFAQANPEAVIEMEEALTAPETRTRAVLRKGLALGVVKKTNGGFLSWNNVTLGANEDSAVSFLHTKDNEPIREELTRAVALTEEVENGGKKPTGKPKAAAAFEFPEGAL